MSTVYSSGAANNDTSWSSSSETWTWMSWRSRWILLLIVFVIINVKAFPLFWHLRLLTSCRFTLRTQRPCVPPNPNHIFKPIITTSTVQLMELDYNIHKSNSTYFADVDIARTHLICALFSRGIEALRGGTGIYTASKDRHPQFGYGLGAVSCSFRREIKPYEDYEMWSRVLAWDEKWVYIVTHFVRKDAVKPRTYTLFSAPGWFGRRSRDDENNNHLNCSSSSSSSSSSSNHDSDEDVAAQEKFVSVVPNGDVTTTITTCVSDAGKHLYATALSKCVFKSGRKTVSPEDMLRISGLLPEPGHRGSKSDMMTLDDIEKERQRGLKVAHILAAQNQHDLEAEFTGADGDALGNHSDITGLVTGADVLSQLFKLRKAGM